MPSFQEIYSSHADRYDSLVRHEDHQGNLKAWLTSALGSAPQRIVELGCGTGRVTRMLLPFAGELHAFDGAAHMVEFARTQLIDPRLQFGVADNGAVPRADASADWAIAGWSLGHVTGFHPDDWQSHAERALNEMRRLVGPRGRIVVIETLGTCVDRAAPPNERLAAFYALMESKYGMARTTLSTDYRFDSPPHALEVMSFFFGAAMAEKVAARASAVIPEFTGVWASAG